MKMRFSGEDHQPKEEPETESYYQGYRKLELAKPEQGSRCQGEKISDVREEEDERPKAGEVERTCKPYMRKRRLAISGLVMNATRSPCWTWIGRKMHMEDQGKTRNITSTVSAGNWSMTKKQGGSTIKKRVQYRKPVKDSKVLVLS